MSNMDQAYRRELSMGTSKDVGYQSRIDDVQANEYSLRIKRDKFVDLLNKVSRDIIAASADLNKV